MTRTVKIMLSIVGLLMILIGGMLVRLNARERQAPELDTESTATTLPLNIEVLQETEALPFGTVLETEETVSETTAEPEYAPSAAYDEKRITKIVSLRDGEVTSEDAYFYDDSGKLLKHVITGYDNRVQTYSVIMEYLYDDAGLLIQRKDAGSPFAECEYHYEHGILTGYTYNEVMDDMVVNSVTYHYERDENGNVVKSTAESIDADLWASGEFQYDDLGRCISACEQKRYGDHEFQTTMTYDYSNRGAVIVTKEENLLALTSTTRMVQLGSMEYGFIEGPELYEGYSVLTDKEGYIVGIKDSDGRLVNSFKYSSLYEQDPFVQSQTSPESLSFSDIPSEFIFSSGAGAWLTKLVIAEDGSFVGEYHDSEMGLQDEEYPNGTVYICNFEGKFSEPQKVSEFVYSMNLESLSVKESPGKVYYEDGIRYITTEPYGMENADTFYIYLPGARIADLPREFLYWGSVDTKIRETLPSGYYGIYNSGAEKGFDCSIDDYIWHRDYMYYPQGRKAALRPSYYDESDLVFWPEDGAAVMRLEFAWRDEQQTEFMACDDEGSGDYQISIDMSEDLSKVMITVLSAEGVDLSAWGGTKDGYLVAEFVDE